MFSWICLLIVNVFEKNGAVYQQKKTELVASSQVERKLEECLMKTANVNKGTLLVKGNVRTKRETTSNPEE